MAPTYIFLHIGKTGGTSFREALRQHEAETGEQLLHMLPHSESVPSILASGIEGKITFCVRDPVKRYVSGFNSRLRRGRDGTRAWNPAEEKAFKRFSTPNDMAEALYSDDEDLRKHARKGIKRSRHTMRGLTHYLGSIEVLEAAKDRIAFIGDQQSLNGDYKVFRALTGIRPDIEMPSDDFGAHRTPTTHSTRLSPLGEANIRKWYKDDFPLYAWCLKRRGELLANG